MPTPSMVVGGLIFHSLRGAGQMTGAGDGLISRDASPSPSLDYVYLLQASRALQTLLARGVSSRWLTQMGE